MQFCKPSFDAVQALLIAARLPSSDLTQDLDHFVGYGDPDNPDGVVGLEVIDDLALLRSLVVTDTRRGLGIGKRLVSAIEEYARDRGVRTIYLLTETAEQFFASLGYQSIGREIAPESIQATREYAELCPSSAAFMVKELL